MVHLPSLKMYAMLAWAIVVAGVGYTAYDVLHQQHQQSSSSSILTTAKSSSQNSNDFEAEQQQEKAAKSVLPELNLETNLKPKTPETTSFPDTMPKIPDTTTSITTTDKITERPHMSYADLYRDGQKAYLANDFQKCSMRMLHALDEHDAFKHRETVCKRRCGAPKGGDGAVLPPVLNADHPLLILMDSDAKEHTNGGTSYSVLELLYLRAALFHTSCLLTCHDELQHQASAISLDVDREFEALMPLDYLQICLFNIGNHAEAANIAYTFLMRHPKHEIMAGNLKFYVESNSIKAESIVNRKRRAYEDSYYTAMDAYNKEEFAKSTTLFELALQEYYEAEENCRAECDGHAVAVNNDTNASGYNYDVVWTITNKLITAMRCRQECPNKLAFFDAKFHEKFLSSLYNYLQYSYYKIGDTESSCAALESFRLFQPDDATALNNELVLERDFAAKPEWFKTRDEAAKYFARQEAEKSLLNDMFVLYGENAGGRNSKGEIEKKEVDEEEKSDIVGESNKFVASEVDVLE